MDHYHGVPATNVQVSPSGTTISAMTPAYAEGAVTVTNIDLLTSFPLTYTYYTKDDDRMVGNGCGTGGGLAVFLLLAFLTVGGGVGRRR